MYVCLACGSLFADVFDLKTEWMSTINLRTLFWSYDVLLSDLRRERQSGAMGMIIGVFFLLQLNLLIKSMAHKLEYL